MKSEPLNTELHLRVSEQFLTYLNSLAAKKHLKTSQLARYILMNHCHQYENRGL